MYSAVLIFLFIVSPCYSQVQTPKSNTINGNCGGYYEYLPQGYNTNTWQNYPVIVFIHGIGETGNGTTDLPNILNCWTALPRLIANGAFPASFNVAGQNFSFIVISPQFRGWPSGSDVNDVINYAVQNYRVDQSRIYVTGLSMGGGAVWDFAGTYPARAAAVVPVCGAAYADPTKAQAIANAKLPVWATHNQNDYTVTSSWTTGWVSMIDQDGGDAISTIWPYTGHDAWSITYDPNFTQNGVNVYQWMLMHKKGGSSPSTVPKANQNPTANAGSNQIISLPTNSVNLTGTGSDPDGSIVSYQWSQTSGPLQAGFMSTAWANTVVNGLVPGTYVFTLKVTDNNGATASSDVTILVNGSLPASTTPPPASGNSSRIEAESYSGMSGVQAANTQDAGGGQAMGWIDNGDWMDYQVSAPSSGNYTVNFRLACPFTGARLQIKNSAGTVLSTVDIPYTGGFENWQTVSASIALAAGTQTIRIQSVASAGFNFNWWEIAGASSLAVTTRATDVAATDVTASTASLAIYPNPIVNSFQLQIDNELTGTLTVQVYDMQGRLQKQFSLTKTDEGSVQYYLSLGEVPAANYIIKATMNGWTQSKQIIKQ